MGFNKRYLSKEKILTVYQSQGLKKLISFIENTDCLIIEDDFSEDVSDIVLNYDYMIIDEKITELIIAHELK
mgnify:CR=1 FL=1|jgi:hypothetical protein